MNQIISSVAVFSMAALMACGGYAVPTQHLADSYAAITSAHALGAEGYPQAALHLKLAEEQQARARQLVADGSNEEADYMASRAKSDAELAVALVRQTVAHARAADVRAQAAKGVEVPIGTTTTTGGTLPVNPPRGPETH